MSTTADKLNKILDSKAKIKSAIEAKGVAEVGDKLADYPSKIASIPKGLDFKEIGYEGTPQDFVDGLEYAKEIQKNWNPNETGFPYYREDPKMVFFPFVDTSNLESMYYAFFGCHNLAYVPDNFNTSKVKNFEHTFQLSGIKKAPKWDYSKGTSFLAAFSSCSSLEIVEKIQTSLATDTSYMFSQDENLKSIPPLDLSSDLSTWYMFHKCYSLKSVSLINTSKVENISYMFYLSHNITTVKEIDMSSVVGYTGGFVLSCYSLSYLLIKNLGKAIDAKDTIRLEGCPKWGDDSIEGSRQSLTDSLITYSYDRKENGMPTATIRLEAAVKGRLTEDEIAQITAKGFTLA